MGYRRASIEGLLLAGDPEAIGKVGRWIAHVLASLRFWSLRSEWLDLHQEVMARVIDSLHRGRFDDRQPLRSYVQAVARYTALEALNRSRRSRVGEGYEDTRPDESANCEDRIAARQLARLVFDHSSDDCRKLIRTYFYEQRSYAEIATSMNVPVGTVKSRLSRCLESIQGAIHQARRGHTRRPLPRRSARPEGS